MSEDGEYMVLFVAKRRSNPCATVESKKQKTDPVPYYGRKPLDNETKHYFLKIKEININEYESKKDKELLAKNVLKQAADKELTIAQDSNISKVLENLLPFAPNSILTKYIRAFEQNIGEYATHRSGSHTLEVLIQVCADRVRNNGERYVPIIVEEFIQKTVSFMFKHWDEFIENPSANQVIRTCLQECSGYKDKKPILPDEIEHLLSAVIKSDLNELAKQVNSSAFLQCLLQCAYTVNVKLAQKMIKRLLEVCFRSEETDESSEVIHTVFNSVCYTRILETMIEVSTGKRYTQILAKIFINRLKILACTKSSYVAVRKLIARCPEATELNLILMELVPVFSQIIAAGFIEVLVELAKACVRLNTSEGDFMKALRTGLGVESKRGCEAAPKDFVEKLVFPNGLFVIKSGSLLLQALLSFKKPIMVVESLLAVNTSLLVNILMDPRGSFIADAFVSSETIGAKSRERLVQKLKGNYKQLALDKNGSRVIDALWSNAKIKEKHTIISELDRTIQRKQQGSIIAAKLKLDLYFTDKKKWEKAQQTSLTAREETSISVKEETSVSVKEETSLPVNEETSPPVKEETD